MEPPSGTALTVIMVGLTVATGVLDAVSFLTLGQVFTATQTGNLLFLGFGIAGQGGLPVAATAVSIAAFLLGAALGARLESTLAAGQRPWFPAALAAEAALLFAAAVAAWEGGPGPVLGRRHVVVALMAVAMGMRNVTSMRAAAPDLTTTVETRAMAALVSGSPLGYGSRAGARRLASVTAMFAGGLLGAGLLGLGTRPTLVILLVAVFVAATAFLMYGLAHGRRSNGG
ncbi:YoaK family protein [Streptomyces sp. NPDC050355]|uniref:YoaK family protein n=1 Tax=Streptomyces sp. NPDC050355 TaxID=3365609 RepID=UPI0037911FE7